MRGHILLRRAVCLALLLLVPTLAFAAEGATETTTAASPTTSRFTLKSSSTEAAPQTSGRYTLRARFAPVESAGELRERKKFTLIGRFGKGGTSCDSTALFLNGFEGG